MLSTAPATALSRVVVALVVLAAGSPLAHAAPPALGACCSSFHGCCPPEGSCFEGTEQECGIAATFQGAGTTCETAQAACLGSTTTITLPAFGACCLFDGFCLEGAEASCQGVGTYQGDSTLCDFVECPVPTTTTTTVPVPIGACCLDGGGCDDRSAKECDGLGAYAGDATTCEFTKCVLPTTSTTMPAGECGDADESGAVTSTDALITLRTAVGSAVCAVFLCDVNDSGSVTSSDALAILRLAVGQSVELVCPGPI